MTPALRERLRRKERADRAEMVRGKDAVEAFLGARRLDGAALAKVLLVADVRGPRAVVHTLDRATVERDARHQLGPHLASAITRDAPPAPGCVRVFVLGRVSVHHGEARLVAFTSPGGVS